MVKLEAGKKYRTRRGELVTITRVTPESKQYPFHGTAKEHSGELHYSDDGTFLIGGYESSFDIVGPGFQLEAKKYYRTRDGRKAYVSSFNVNPFTTTNYPYAGYLDDDDSDSAAACWTSDGVFVSGVEASKDLVEEWRDPPKAKEYTVYLVQYDDGSVYPRAHPKNDATWSGKVIGKKTVTVTEGEGL